MRHCTQCGHVLDEGDHYCDFCSSVLDFSATRSKTDKPYFCAYCGGLLPTGMDCCPVCGTRAGVLPPELTTTPILPAEEARPPGPLKKLFFPAASSSTRLMALPGGGTLYRSTAVVTAWILLVSFVAIFLWRFLPYFLPENTFLLSNAALYVKADGTLNLSYPDRSPYQIADSYQWPRLPAGVFAARASSDGKRLAYLNASRPGAASGGLYWLDLSPVRQRDFQPAESTLLAPDAYSDFAFLEGSGSLILRNTDNELLLWNGKTTVLLDTDVTEIFSVGSRQILYAKKGDYLGMIPQQQVYLRILSNAEPVCITSQAAQLLDYSTDYTFFLYSKPVQDPLTKRYHYEICSYHVPLFQAQTLVSGVSEVLEADADKRTLLFSREAAFVPTYDDYLDDPMAAQDALTLPPDPNDYGLPENFRDIFEGGPDSGDRLEELELEAAYDEAYFEYRQMARLYDEKAQRDILREQIQEEFLRLAAYPLKQYSLYRYAGDGVHPLDEDILSLDEFGRNQPLSQTLQADKDGQYVAYTKTSVEDLPVFTLADWGMGDDTSQPDLPARFTQELPQRLCVYSLAGAASAPETVSRLTDGRHADYALAGRHLFYRVTHDQQPLGDLYCLPVDNLPANSANPAQIAEPLLIDTAVEALFPEGHGFGALALYTRRSEGNRTSLYSWSSATTPVLLVPELVSTPAFTLRNGGKSLLYYRRYLAGEGATPGRGELFLRTRQEDRMVIGDVYAWDYRGDRLIYLTRNMDTTGAFELQVYREGGVSTIDTGLQRLVPIGT